MSGRSPQAGRACGPSDLSQSSLSQPEALVPNAATPEGRALGVEIARICDTAAASQGRDGRCATCAFRAGDHLANGSPATLMTAIKCAAEREPFWCHEDDKPCAGWSLMRFPAAATVEMPWGHIGGADEQSERTGA